MHLSSLAAQAAYVACYTARNVTSCSNCTVDETCIGPSYFMWLQDSQACCSNATATLAAQVMLMEGADEVAASMRAESVKAR